VPASFEFSLASLKPHARSSGTSIPSDSSAGRLNSVPELLRVSVLS